MSNGEKQTEAIQTNFKKDMTVKGIKRAFLDKLEYSLAKDKYTATLNDNFFALAMAIRDRIIDRWMATQQSYHKKNVKRVYYLSMEFLLGRLFDNNIRNLGLRDTVKKAMASFGLDTDQLCECERDPGLGSGGLGRLAACFLDSLATMKIPAQGYGILYEYGIFKQRIVNGYQVEAPDEWMRYGNPWEFPRQEYITKVRFGGKTQTFIDAQGRLRVRWFDTEDILALPYDIPILGYQSDVVNNLRLWAARGSEEFDFTYFNDGDYEGAVYKKISSESISKVLYPNDSIVQGKELRLKQEYFLVAATIADIIRRFKQENSDFHQFPEKVAIQLNDTHPAGGVVELMRRLLDDEGLNWDAAWDVTVRTFAYTNHTVMPEALEQWSVPLFERLLPRHMQIIYEINRRFLEEVAIAFPGDIERLRRMSIIQESEPKQIRMAHLAIVGSHAVNGVSKLHSDIIATNVFRDFADIWPEKFSNKTNGISQRRWLQQANPGLAQLISDVIGDEWVTDHTRYAKLVPFAKDASFQQRWAQVKLKNKRDLSKHIYYRKGITINPHSLFDVQIKRIHEYKRQLLLGLYIIAQYLKVHHDPNVSFTPRAFIVAGKAVPGYFMAKLIVKFLTSIGAMVNRDKRVGDRLKVVFLENYDVSLAEKIIPASDLSEQISTAGMEASGTGCMKLMMNGALTIGTCDGANIEIAEAVGEENMFLFGLQAHEVDALRKGGYRPQEFIDRSPALQAVLSLIESNFLSSVEHNLFKPILDNLRYSDPYFVCADFDAYCAAQDIVSWAYGNTSEWRTKSILNTATSGRFSSDRTIAEYMRDIWRARVSPAVRV